MLYFTGCRRTRSFSSTSFALSAHTARKGLAIGFADDFAANLQAAHQVSAAKCRFAVSTFSTLAPWYSLGERVVDLRGQRPPRPPPVPRFGRPANRIPAFAHSKDNIACGDVNVQMQG
ncbi:hypothetical protein ES703_119650 [subsurface metagenome]